MRRLGVWAAGVLAAAVIGCGPGKELPDELPKAEPKAEPKADPLGNPPPASDPAAKAVVDRAVTAISGGDPTRLAKARVAVAHYRGSFYFPNSPTPAEATCRWEVVWPDRALVVYQFRDGVQPSVTFRLLRHHGWLTVGAMARPDPPTEMARVIQTECFAQHGVVLGLTLTDPRAVFFDPHKSDAPAGTAVKIGGLPDTPVLRVTFEEATGLPVRVEYHPLEVSQPVRVKKVFTMSGHQPGQGLQLPTDVELQQNGRPAEKWTLEKWEFPEKIDDAKFDPPK